MLAKLSTGGAVHDSKNPEGPALLFGDSGWHGFLNSLKAGRFDR